MVKILFTSVLKFWLFGAFSWHRVDFVSNCTVGLFLGTKLAQFPSRPRCSQRKKRSLNSVPNITASHPPPLSFTGPQNNSIMQQETTPTSLPLKAQNGQFFSSVYSTPTSGWVHLENSVESLLWAPTCVTGFEYKPQVACEKCHCRFAN